MLKIDNITKTFGMVAALRGLSFEVSDGEILGLLGPNGAGKTTTMRIMTGFISADKGDVIVDGVSVFENPTKAQSMMGYLPENNPLYKDMLVSDFLSFSASLKAIPASSIADSVRFAVKSVGISDVYYRPIGELSKGFKQRVGIATALLHKPKILILDEPTEGLDPNQRTEIRNLIKELSKNHTIIISTHVMQEVEAVCTRAVIINNGNKVADGPVEDLLSPETGTKVIRISAEGMEVENTLKKLPNVVSVEVKKTNNGLNTYLVKTQGSYKIQPDISREAGKQGWTIWELSEEKAHLEDIFKELTKEN